MVKQKTPTNLGQVWLAPSTNILVEDPFCTAIKKIQLAFVVAESIQEILGIESCKPHG